MAWAGMGVARAALLWAPGAGTLALIEALWPVLPPLALAGLALLLAGGPDPEPASEDEAARLAGVRAEAEQLDAALDRLETRLTGIRQQAAALVAADSGEVRALEARSEALAVVVTTLATQGAEAREGATALADVLPQLEAGVAGIRSGLLTLGEDSSSQLRAAEALLQRVQAWHAEASARADAAVAALASHHARIDEASRESTAAIAKRSYALDAAVDGVLGRVETVMAEVGQQLDATLARIDSGLDGAGRQLTLLGEEGVRLFSQRLDALIDSSRTLESRLADHGRAADALQAALAQGVETAGAITSPLESASAILAALDAQGDAMRDRMAALTTQLVASLEACESALARFDAGAEALEAGRLRLVETVSGTVGTLAEASATQDAAEARLAALATAMAGQFEAASAALADMEAAASRATAGSQRAAEAAVGRMLGLVEAVSQTEARIGEVETRFAQRERGTLARDASRLLSGLSAHVGEMAHLLQLDVPEEHWRNWLRGDRSALPGVVRPLLEADDQRRLRRHIEHDPAFRTESLRFLDQFEALIGRLLGDRDGEGLAATILSSDIGKLYVRLAEAAGRIV